MKRLATGLAIAAAALPVSNAAAVESVCPPVYDETTHFIDPGLTSAIGSLAKQGIDAKVQVLRPDSSLLLPKHDDTMRAMLKRCFAFGAHPSVDLLIISGKHPYYLQAGSGPSFVSSNLEKDLKNKGTSYQADAAAYLSELIVADQQAEPKSQSTPKSVSERAKAPNDHSAIVAIAIASILAATATYGQMARRRHK